MVVLLLLCVLVCSGKDTRQPSPVRKNFRGRRRGRHQKDLKPVFESAGIQIVQRRETYLPNVCYMLFISIQQPTGTTDVATKTVPASHGASGAKARKCLFRARRRGAGNLRVLQQPTPEPQRGMWQNVTYMHVPRNICPTQYLHYVITTVASIHDGTWRWTTAEK